MDTCECEKCGVEIFTDGNVKTCLRCVALQAAQQQPRSPPIRKGRDSVWAGDVEWTVNPCADYGADTYTSRDCPTCEACAMKRILAAPHPLELRPDCISRGLAVCVCVRNCNIPEERKVKPEPEPKLCLYCSRSLEIGHHLWCKLYYDLNRPKVYLGLNAARMALISYAGDL